MRLLLAAAALAGFVACSSTAAPNAGDPETVADAGTDAATKVALGLNDVSILEPLPGSPREERRLGPESAGAKGQLLPKPVFAKIPEFPVTTAHSLAFERMRVVAIRVDGCHGAQNACQAQIRMVMQPIGDTGKARDSSLHLFYSLPDDEFARVVQGLRELRALAPEQTPDSPLSVSPALSAQGVGGAYGEALHALVLAHCGEENLTRMTFFLRAPPNQETWFFGGFERNGDSLTTLDIVGVGKGNQRVIRIESADGYEFDVLPQVTKPENGNVLLSSKTAEAATEEARAAAFASYVRLENPARYGPDDLPCAGCHLSAFLVGEAGRRFGLGLDAFPDDRFGSTWLEGERATRGAESGSEASSLRAFGYFDARPMISPRVVNESAAVLQDLEARY